MKSAHHVVRQSRGDGTALGRRVSASSSQCLRGVLPPDERSAGDPQSDHRHGPYMSAPDLHDAEAWHHRCATGHGRLRTTVPGAGRAAFDPSGESLRLYAGPNTRGNSLLTISPGSSSLEGRAHACHPGCPAPPPALQVSHSVPSSAYHASLCLRWLKLPCSFLLQPLPGHGRLITL